MQVRFGKLPLETGKLNLIFSVAKNLEKLLKQYLCPGARSREPSRASRARGDAATHPEVTGGAGRQTATVLILPTVGHFPLGSPPCGARAFRV